MAMVLLIVGGGWLYLSFGRALPEVSEPVTPTPVDTRIDVPEEIDPRFDLGQNLDMGELALDAGQLVEPADGSALYFFLSAREQDPGNVVAEAGLARIVGEMATRADAQLAGEEFAELNNSMRVIERIDAAHPELLRLQNGVATVIEEKLAAVDGAIRRQQWVPAQALLDQLSVVPGIDGLVLIERADQLATAQETAATEAAEREAQAAAAAAAPEAEQAQAAAGDAASDDANSDGDEAEADTDAEAGPDVDALFATFIRRLDAGDLLAPDGASARDALNDLAREAPDDPTSGAARLRLVSALADRAVALGGQDQFENADELLDAATLLDADNPRIAASRDAVLDRRVTLEGQRVIPVGELVNTRVVRPRYPQRALRNEAEGYVLLNFTVQRDGSTSDFETVEVSDRYGDQFERAAILAVRQWEFEPREYLGRSIAQRVEARVTFELEP